MNPVLKIAVEAGPLVVFFAAYAWGDIFVATAAFMIAVIVALSVSWLVHRRIPMVPLFTAIIVMVFGGLTLWFNDETFVKMKPTIINAAFALALLAGLIFDRPLLKPLFDSVFQVDDKGWRLLTWRWALFFAAMAVLNEIVWRSFSTDVWVSVKVFGYLPLTLIFSVMQMPLIQRHGIAEEPEAAD
ncbi:MAG: septation protein A [Alphaproteobacteria bacterium]|nr:septation protein A [Alphaproteobacteria bacterium]